MIESPKNMPAFLLDNLPKDMCRELFRVFSIQKIGDLDERNSIMLWRSLLKIYFPYLRLDEKNTTPKSLMNTFMNERQNTENHLSETEGVIENIDANLMMSALSGNIKLIEKADLNTSSKEALYGLALANGHYKVLFKLDAEALKRTLSFVADIRGNKALLNIMENVGKIICKKVDSRWIFQLAFESECWDVMFWIHENYNVSNRDLKKTLVKFSSEGHLDWVKLILEKCNNIHISQLEAAILGALQNGHVAVIRLIMNNYPDINIDELALQALEDAAQKGDLARVKNILLVCDSMDNNYLLNVLKKAIEKGHFEVFRYIIENVQGIDLKEQAPELLYIAAKYQQREIVRFLQMVSPSSAGKALWKASFFGYLKRVKLILEECPTISVEEKEKAQRANKNPIGSATYNLFKNVLAESIEKQKTHLANHERFFLQYYENAWYNAGLNVQDEHDPKMDKLSKNQSSCILS